MRVRIILLSSIQTRQVSAALSAQASGGWISLVAGVALLPAIYSSWFVFPRAPLVARSLFSWKAHCGLDYLRTSPRKRRETCGGRRRMALALISEAPNSCRTFH